MAEAPRADAPPADCDPADGVAAAALTPALAIMQRRADFLRAASARRQGTAGFLLQARLRDAAETPAQVIRVGFTCSKKIGNAVARNRAKRRLRALAREIMPGAARPGWDYVLVGRPEATIARDFADLRTDLASALRRVHAAPERDSDKAPDSAPRRRGRR